MIAWPIVLGCDASGIVVKVGSTASSTFKEGDRVCGCTRLGVPGYSTFQEYFCMDAPLTLPFSKDISFQQGATIGVGTYTACLGLFTGLKLELPDLASSAASSIKDEWIIILGGAGSVGQYSIQIAKALGYKVITSCSKSTAALVRDLGADAVVDYSKSEADQLSEIKDVTAGNFFGVWDTVAKSESLGRKALTQISVSKTQKYFATTDDWSPMKEYGDEKTYRAKLGIIGREGEEIADSPTVNEDLASYVRFLGGLLEMGKLRPNELKVVSTGFEGVAEAVAIQQKGVGGGKKVVVDLQASE